MIIKEKEICKTIETTSTVKQNNSFYENIIFKYIKDTKSVFALTTAIYLAMVVGIVLLLPIIFRNNIPSVYINAGIALATLIFWPAIITCNSRFFYHVFSNIKVLFMDKNKADDWYLKTAKEAFNPFAFKHNEEYKKNGIKVFIPLIIQIIILLGVMVTCMIPNCYNCNPFENFKYFLLFIAPVTISFALLLFSKVQKNLHTIIFVIICGFSYYLYLFQYSSSEIVKITNDFIGNDIFENIFVTLLVGVVFFIAGTTIYPLIQLLYKFFLNKEYKLEENLKYPLTNLSCSIDKLKSIKNFFSHLMGINLIAYFQLLATVYLLGVFNSDSTVTIILFVIGSFFPSAMYLASNILFKRLSMKIYIHQVQIIDCKIDELVARCDLSDFEDDNEKLQALLATKEMYLEEFEVHTSMNKEVFAAMLSPVITAAIALIFPSLGI